MVWVWSLDLTQKDGDEAEESVKCQKETFIHSFLSLCVRGSGRAFSLSVCERSSSDRIAHSPSEDAGDGT